MNSTVSAVELFVRKALSGGSGTRLNMFLELVSSWGQKDQKGRDFSKEEFLSMLPKNSEDEGTGISQGRQVYNIKRGKAWKRAFRERLRKPSRSLEIP